MCEERSDLPASTFVRGAPTETVEEMRADLDTYLETYNQRRPHRARGIERGTGDIYLPKIRRIVLITRFCSSSVIFVEHGMLIAVS